MEAITAVVLLASRYGVRRIVSALSGQQDLGELASELLGALAASEDRLDERLASIETQLDEVLDQRYSTSIREGLRLLAERTPGLSLEYLHQDLLLARNSFVAAVAAARTSLQVAIAERYLVLCNIALSREAAARVAMERVDAAATEAALEAGTTIANVRQEIRNQERKYDGLSRLRQAIEDRYEERRDRDQRGRLEAASSVAMLAKNLLGEMRILAPLLGVTPQTDPKSNSLDPLPLRFFMGAGAVNGNGILEIKLPIPGTARVGAILVDWFESADIGRVRVGLPSVPTVGYAAAAVFRIGVDVSLKSPLTRDLEVRIACDHDTDDAYFFSAGEWRPGPPSVLIPAGQMQVVLAQTVAVPRYHLFPIAGPPPQSKPVVVIGNTLCVRGLQAD